jgi:hypothetical protein
MFSPRDVYPLPRIRMLFERKNIGGVLFIGASAK